MADMDKKEMEAAVESILFASGEPVNIERICVALAIDRPTAERILQGLIDYYAYERRGMRLLKIEDCWQLCSAPDYAEAIRRAFEIRKPAKLSQPALEVLTIIAYYQPVTRAYVDQIRGVDSSYTMSLLLDRGMIEECGRLQVPGRPRQYRTTKQFLRSFHLSSLDELPAMPDMGTRSARWWMTLRVWSRIRSVPRKCNPDFERRCGCGGLMDIRCSGGAAAIAVPHPGRCAGQVRK